MLSEAILGAIAEATIGYALDQSGLADYLRAALGRDPVKRAFTKALDHACRAIEESDPAPASKLFDESFLRHEARPVLAQLLWRHGRPTGMQFAGAWADSLGLQDKIRDEALAGIAPTADRFLALLEDAAKKQEDLQEIFDRRAGEHTAENTARILAVLEERWPPARDSRPVAPVPTRIPDPRSVRFIGRKAELKWLCQQLSTNGVAAVVGVRGIGGIGKTELAIAAVQQLKSHFAGNVEWFDCGPNDVAAIQERMASALGFLLPGTDLTVRADALHQAWRARAPTLVVLDDLRRRHLGGYAHLIPPCPPCALLITSRRSDLPLHNPDAIRELDPLAKDESGELLATLLPAAWLAAEPEIAAAVVKLLDNIPLALMLAARRGREIAKRRKKPSQEPIAQSQITPLAALYQELTARRIEVLDQGSAPDRPDLSVIITFNFSYDELEPQDQARLRKMGVFARNEFTLSALQAVWGDDEKTTRRALRRLTDAGLIQETDEGDTWWMHDLLREYAAERLARAGAEAEDATRLAHANYWRGYLEDIDLRSLEAWTVLEACRAEIKAAADWLLSGSGRHPEAAAELIIEISQTFQSYTFPEWERWLQAGLVAAEKSGQRNTLRRLQRSLGEYYRWRGQIPEAERLLRASLATARDLLQTSTTAEERDTGQRGVAVTQSSLANLLRTRGQYDEAERLYRESLQVKEQVGDRREVAVTQSSLADLLRTRGQYDEAERLYRESLQVKEQVGDRRSVAVTQSSLADLLRTRGQYD